METASLTNPDLHQLLHEVEEQWVDLLQLQNGPGHHQSQIAHGGATHLSRGTDRQPYQHIHKPDTFPLSSPDLEIKQTN